MLTLKSGTLERNLGWQGILSKSGTVLLKQEEWEPYFSFGLSSRPSSNKTLSITLTAFYSNFRYSGPDSSLVTNRFTIDFGTYYSANKSVVQVLIDGSGNNLQGSKTLYSIYRKLGTLEIEDQLTVIR